MLSRGGFSAGGLAILRYGAFSGCPGGDEGCFKLMIIVADFECVGEMYVGSWMVCMQIHS